MLPYRSASNFGTIDDPIEGTINSLAKDLQRLNVDYAIAGGNALKVHGFKRFTTDVDVLLAKGGKNELNPLSASPCSIFIQLRLASSALAHFCS